jgi:Fur family ferric uptake transcriptional regulator
MAKDTAQRITQQREVILEELKNTHSHPTADELYAVVRKRLPKVSLGTVYRNLERMAESGEIRKIEGCGGQKRFDGDTKVHYHARCLACGRIDDVPIKPAKNLERAAMEETGYQITEHKVLFFGYCPKCKNKIHKHG